MHVVSLVLKAALQRSDIIFETGQTTTYRQFVNCQEYFGLVMVVGVLVKWHTLSANCFAKRSLVWEHFPQNGNKVKCKLHCVTLLFIKGVLL